MNKFFLLAIAAVYCLSGCMTNPCGSTKEGFIENYDGLVQTIKDADLSYSDQQWKEYDATFKKYVEECYEEHENDMTIGEKRDFWIKAIRYYYKRYGAGLTNELFNDENPTSKKIRDNIQKLWDDPEKALRDMFKDIGGGEVDQLLNDLKSDINKWSKKLENLFKKRR